MYTIRNRSSIHCPSLSPLPLKMGGHRSASAPAGAGASSASSFISAFCSAALRRKTLPVGPTESRSDDLVRGLGLVDLVLIGIGASIGAGIFVVTGTVARDAGPALFSRSDVGVRFVHITTKFNKRTWYQGVTISFVLAGAACVLNALCYAELSSRFPAVVGGAYLYTYTAFNELTAFLVFAQLMLDYHIGAASIARSLASYLVSFLELFPFLKGHFPSWFGHGGEEFFGGVVSINVLVPILLTLLTVILCYGVKESSAVNSFMTATKVLIVIFVVLAGAFEVDVSNWSPFAPNGIKAVVTGATVVFFAYVGFDAVANSAEESKRPQRDLPIGILGSLVVCILLYVAVCLVITGMVPYQSLGEEAPLAEAFTGKGLKYVSVLISIGAVVGLTTTLLVGLYVQSRLYLGLARDGLLPSIFSKVHLTRHTPIHSQIWVGCVAAVLGGLFNVHMLSHILSVGTLTGYSVVSACLITLRWKDKPVSQASGRCISTWLEGTICLLIVACCGFSAGLCYRFDASLILSLLFIFVAFLAAAALHFRQVYVDPPGFSCPGVPTVPVASIFFNIFLFAQLHEEAWYRFVIISFISIAVYAIYGQYHANPATSNQSVDYHRVSLEEA